MYIFEGHYEKIHIFENEANFRRLMIGNVNEIVTESETLLINYGNGITFKCKYADIETINSVDCNGYMTGNEFNATQRNEYMMTLVSELLIV